MYMMLAQLALQGYNMYSQYKATKEAKANHDRKMRINKQLAAEQLAVTYNSIMAKNIEIQAEFKRKEFQLAAAARKAEGSAKVQAAVTGAAGKRVELSRNMEILGGKERAMSLLEIDAKRAADALIARADAEERATVNRLISSAPDAPVDYTQLDAIQTAANSLDIVNNYIDRQAQLKDDTVGAQLATD